MNYNPLLASGDLILITVKNFKADARIGAYEHEKSAPQPMRFTVSVYAKRSKSGDDLSGVYNYDLISQAIRSAIEAGHTALQETVVERIGNAILKDAKVLAVHVRSEKLQACPEAESVSVERFFAKENASFNPRLKASYP